MLEGGGNDLLFTKHIDVNISLELSMCTSVDANLQTHFFSSSLQISNRFSSTGAERA